MNRLRNLTNSQSKRRESGVEFDDFTNFSRLSHDQLIDRCKNLRKQLNQMNKLSDYWINKAAIYAETKEQHDFLFKYVRRSLFCSFPPKRKIRGNHHQRNSHETKFFFTLIYHRKAKENVKTTTWAPSRQTCGV
jgi:hypothetical protein